jgi:hypothetical protein
MIGDGACRTHEMHPGTLVEGREIHQILNTNQAYMDSNGRPQQERIIINANGTVAVEGRNYRIENVDGRTIIRTASGETIVVGAKGIEEYSRGSRTTSFDYDPNPFRYKNITVNREV